MSRILSVWLPTWPVTVWRRKNPSAEPGKPFALVIAERGVRRLYAVDEAACVLGLYAGQKAADAAALVPELSMEDADPEGDAEALAALSDWCVRFSPAVALDAPDGLFLDVTGVTHLWGGEAAMADDLLARLASNGIPAKAAIADTAGAAWALARFSLPPLGEVPAKPGMGAQGRRPARLAPSVASRQLPQGGSTWIIAPPGEQGPLLEPLPVTALRLDDTAAAQLPRLGLTRVGRVMKLPRAQLTKRFGKGVVLRLDQALGHADEALTFRRQPNPWFERLAFAEPISTPDDLARAAADITAQICARLETEGQGARRFEAAFHRLDGKVQTAGAGLSLAGRNAPRIAKLIAPKLDVIDPGFGIEVVTITADGVETISPRQQRLDAQAEATAEEGLAPLVDRLANRLGEDRVWRAEPFESHVPERSVVRQPPMTPKTGRGWDPDRPRPIRLFRRPEAIDALALVPDDPPRQFRWRGRVHRVLKAEGPERIGAEWWRQPIDDVSPDQVRDYYRVEDEHGARFWLFRAGLYDPEAPPKWWLHGLFG
jgi:protein ImuB